ncbi:hypothetical protein M5X00_26105 [Paenibacillus alvei]|uniref:hypothetical protein n=1 Tax=Paenibacillus alvei TaxID=44250 RepID=UPI000288A863|nr:hypothetical protein [Paenibacillus alvei]EJW13912.1 hypothetical protein PAV_141p00180 [Paenibacillus alvei DSM 29]MCY9544704.1 hypothetical protein [Paenibacillus alvei]MCY9707724.1 hypothetical protein [Paenibacillus alvei]MCY9757705.1 hypothetical protein [Paenibacillus alvei]MEC0082763.1 hypothetical protein [Paenibacillus alvei]
MVAIKGQSYEQTKAIDGFPYNAVGEIWCVNNMQGKYTILKHEGIGLGVDENELKEHFKLVGYSYSNDNGEEECDEYEEEEEEEYDDEDHQDEDADNKQISKFKSFLRKIGFK